jgi:hypothetical protein
MPHLEHSSESWLLQSLQHRHLCIPGGTCPLCTATFSVRKGQLVTRLEDLPPPRELGEQDGLAESRECLPTITFMLHWTGSSQTTKGRYIISKYHFFSDFLFLFIIALLGVHCDIYESS